MYRSLSISLIFLIAITGCNKPEEKSKVSKGIAGDWEYTEYYYSIGGPGLWRPVTPAGQIVAFNTDGSFHSVASFSETFRNYQVIDSATVKFTPASTSSGYVLMHFKIDSTEGTLILNPIEPMCIEGCGYKFSPSR